MHKIMILVLLPLLAYASYNPFFKPNKPVVRQKTIKTNISKVVKKPNIVTNVAISYFAYLETSKGKFAIVNFNGKTIVIHQGDSLYLGNKVYKVTKLTSSRTVWKG